MKLNTLHDIARTMPTEGEIDNIIRRRNYIDKYKIYEVYKDSLSGDTTYEQKLHEFICRCKSLDLGKLNTLMYFFFHNQPILSNERLWDDMFVYIQDNHLVDENSDKKFRSPLVAVKWISGYRLAIMTLQEEMDKLNYDTNWKDPNDVCVPT